MICLLISGTVLLQAETTDRAASGLSTTFIGVVLNNVPAGNTVQVEQSDGRGVDIQNTGISAIRVRVRIRIPIPERLRPGALAIPDRNWIQVWPSEMVIEPGETGVFDLKLTVPDRKEFIGKTYQAMIWIRGVPQDAQGLPVGGGLLTRLRFTTTPADKK